MISPSYCAFLVLLCWLHCLSSMVEGCSIHVDPGSVNSTNSTICWQGGVPCDSVELGLRGLQQHNKTILCIAAISGGYNILADKNFTFEYMSDIAIIGTQSTDNDPVVVNCTGEAGLTFRYTRNITIQSIRLIGCGTLQLSTSKNLSSDGLFKFAYFYATLYFLYCEDVHLKNITVSNSTGIGAVLYSSVGTNTVDSSYFTDNIVRDDAFPGGGGLYIEFPYCTPGLNVSDPTDKNSCKKTNVPDLHSTEYMITNSHFTGNNGSIVNTAEHTFILPQNETHLAFGRGGGISVFFKGNAHNNTVSIINCNISDNTALWGAGLFVEFQDMTHENLISIQSSYIYSNQVLNYLSPDSGTGGGGARVGYIFFDQTHSSNNRISFNDVHFKNNEAYFGGGLSFYVSREKTSVATNRLEFMDCTWESNTARVGTAVDLSVWHPVPEGAVVKPSFSNCAFTSNNAFYTQDNAGTFVGLGALYSDSIPILFNDQVQFSSNTHTALAAVGTGIFVGENVIVKFHNNTGRNGGALALMGYAFIEVSENAMLYFTNNSADLKGGAIYGHSIGEHDLISSRNCFIRYTDIHANTSEWKAKFFFKDNTANNVFNSIYATSLLTCSWGGAFGSAEEATKKVFCWNDNWSYSPGNCTDNIATSPASFSPLTNHTNSTTDLDGSDSYYTLELFPGKRKPLPFSMHDDNHKDVTNHTVLIARVVNSSAKVFLDSSSVYISDNAVEVHGFADATGTLTIETIDPRVISTQVDVTILDCPPGMVLSSDSNGNNVSCLCKPKSYNQHILCDQHNYSTLLQRGAWIGKVHNKTLAGLCPFCAAIDSSISQYISLPQDSTLLETTLCNKIHRTDTLCGKCIDGYGPAVNSKNFDCVSCPIQDVHINWLKYLLTEFLPITIFFFIVIIFNVSVTSGPANAFIFFAQMTTTALKLNGDGLIQVDDVLNGGHTANDILCTVPYDIWNLNFFRPYIPPFCLSPNITTLQLIATGYVTAIYPLILIVVFSIFTKVYSSGFRPIVFIFRPLHACFVRVRRIWDIQKSIIHALATFLVLSYTKFTLVSFILLTTTSLVNEDGTNVHYHLYFDGTIQVGSADHRPYLIPSVLFLCTFVALPPIALILPSIMHLLQKGNPKVPDLCGGAHCSQFLNAFHGCYKDGTGGDNSNKHDYRWFAGLYFILRIVLLAIYAFTYDWVVQLVLQLIVSVGALLTFVILRPYKNDLYNKVDAAFFCCIILLCILSLHNFYSSVVGLASTMPWWTFVAQYLLLIVPLIYMSTVVIFHLWVKNKTILKKIFHKCTVKLFNCGNKGEPQEPIQNDNAFFQDAEVAGRFGGRDKDSLYQRPSVLSGESEPLLENEQPPPHSSGSSRGSGSQQRRSNESGGSQYGALQISAGTQTPVSDFEGAESSFGSAGVEKLHVEFDEKESTLQKRRKNLFFTH